MARGAGLQKFRGYMNYRTTTVIHVACSQKLYMQQYYERIIIMPTEEKRINLVVHRNLYCNIVAFRENFNKEKWWKTYSLSYVCCWIIKQYLKEHMEWRDYGC